MDTVTVACKLSMGLKAEVMGPVTVEEVQGPGGAQKVGHAEVLKRFTFRGSRDERVLDRADDKGNPLDHPGVQTVQGGYGLTPNVPKDFWDAWLEQNKNSPLVINRIIFAAGKPDAAAAQAREQREVRTGFEPIDPANPGRVGNVKIERASDKVAT